MSRHLRYFQFSPNFSMVHHPLLDHWLLSMPLMKVNADPNVTSSWPNSNLTPLLTITNNFACWQMTAFVEEHNLLPKIQSAYPRHHSTKKPALQIIWDTACQKWYNYRCCQNYITFCNIFFSVVCDKHIWTHQSVVNAAAHVIIQCDVILVIIRVSAINVAVHCLRRRWWY